MPAPTPAPTRLTPTHWLILALAAIGFAFDIYELLMMPIIARFGLAELLGVDADTNLGQAAVLKWTGYITYASAVSGGVFGLLGGYLTDRLGRRRVLTWSILLYAFSAVGAGFATSVEMLLVLRCTTFIGVCVEFVAAVAWLSELFPNPRQREAVLGYTQACSSFGGLMVTAAFGLCIQWAPHLPAIHGGHAPWRYTLISGLIPALPLIVIRPFLPESPVWAQKKAAGTLGRPSILKLFSPEFLRTSLVTAVLFACAYGAAFGALQLTPQIVPGLKAEAAQLPKLRAQLEKAPEDSAERKSLKDQIRGINLDQQQTVVEVNFYQETGGLVGRFLLAYLAIRIVGRRRLLWTFLLPGLLLFPLTYGVAASGNLGENSVQMLKYGIFLCGLVNVAQFSFWGNYLPRLYPPYLRGTGEGFAANVGGRLFGTLGTPLTAGLATVVQEQVAGISRPASIAYTAAGVALGFYLIATITCCFLPEKQSVEE